MKKREVTDAMVERAHRANWGKYIWGNDDASVPDNATPKQRMRAALEAALNPPPEPEVTVTEEMISASGLWERGCTYHMGTLTSTQIENAYRAMRRLEPGSRGSDMPEEARQNGVKDDALPKTLWRVSDPTFWRVSDQNGTHSGRLIRTDERTGPKDRRSGVTDYYSYGKRTGLNSIGDIHLHRANNGRRSTDRK